MRWIRTNRRHGAWCALLAMAIQIIVSFGHAHGIEGFRQGAFLPQATAGSHNQLTNNPDDPNSKPVRLAFDHCAICEAVKMGASVMPADAPRSGVPVDVTQVQFSPHAEAPLSTSGHLLFQARAPPSA
jgi:hypothetical protein